MNITPKTAARKQLFQKIGKAISVQKQNAADKNIDAYHGGTGSNPWRVVKGATGYFGMQIDNRPGVARREAEVEPEQILLSPRDQEALMHSILNPPEPNAALCRAFSRR